MIHCIYATDTSLEIQPSFIRLSSSFRQSFNSSTDVRYHIFLFYNSSLFPCLDLFNEQYECTVVFTLAIIRSFYRFYEQLMIIAI